MFNQNWPYLCIITLYKSSTQSIIVIPGDVNIFYAYISMYITEIKYYNFLFNSHKGYCL